MLQPVRTCRLNQQSLHTQGGVLMEKRRDNSVWSALFLGGSFGFFSLNTFFPDNCYWKLLVGTLIGAIVGYLAYRPKLIVEAYLELRDQAFTKEMRPRVWLIPAIMTPVTAYFFAWLALRLRASHTQGWQLLLVFGVAATTILCLGSAGLLEDWLSLRRSTKERWLGKLSSEPTLWKIDLYEGLSWGAFFRLWLDLLLNLLLIPAFIMASYVEVMPELLREGAGILVAVFRGIYWLVYQILRKIHCTERTLCSSYSVIGSWIAWVLLGSFWPEWSPPLKLLATIGAGGFSCLLGRYIGIPLIAPSLQAQTSR